MMYSPEGLNDLSNLFGETEPTWDSSFYAKQLNQYRSFSGEEERNKAFYDMCVDPGILSMSCARKLISMGFLSAPASTKYHGSYKGGLFDHSYSVATTLAAFTETLGIHWEDKNSPIRIGILHDICKIDQYLHDETTDSYRYNEHTIVTGHGMKSVVLAQQLPGVSLTEEEIACIIYHMGAFTEKSEWNHYTDAVHRYPNVLWTHMADMYSAHVLELS